MRPMKRASPLQGLIVKLQGKRKLMTEVNSVIPMRRFKAILLRVRSTRKSVAVREVFNVSSLFPELRQQLISFSPAFGRVFQDLQKYGPSYKTSPRRRKTASEAKGKEGGADELSEVINTSLVCKNSSYKTVFRTLNEHEQALFQCEDDQFELDRRIHLLESAMTKVKSKEMLAGWEIARLARAFGCDKSIVEDFIGCPDAFDALVACYKSYKDHRDESNEVWKEIYKKHYREALRVAED